MTTTQLKLPMPRLGETMDEGTIAEWLVAPGADFARGDPLLEVETDKTMVEYPALGGGRLVETLVAPGDLVPVGAPIAVIETEDPWDGIEVDTPAAKPPEPSAPAAAPQPTGAGTKTNRPRATPLARNLARRKGVALDGITGTGRRGRIEARDIEGHAVQPKVPVNTAPVLFIHGFAGLGSNWAAVRAAVQKRGLNADAPDMPGHGRNADPAPNAQALIDWLTGVLRQQSRPVHLVAHSLGAHVAVVAARAAPGNVAQLTLLAPAGCGPDINGRFLSGLANASSAGEVRHLLRLIGPVAAGLPDIAVAAMAEDSAKGRLAALAEDMARGDTQRIDTIAPLADLVQRMPVTAIFGLADQVVPKEHVFNMPPQVACHLVRTGHMPHWDAPALVDRIVSGR